MAALARAALLSSRLNFATEVWPLLIDKDGVGGIWLGADYIPFERCIWTAGTRQQPNAGEEAGTSFSAAGKSGGACKAPPLVPPKRSSRPIRVEEEEEPHEVLARKMANQKGNGKAVLDVNGDASFSHTQYATDAQGRTVSVHGPGQEEATTTTGGGGGGGGGGEVWVLLL